VSEKKPVTWIAYEQRLRRVTQYIHQHLDEPLDLRRLAAVACLSPYHWHRIYHGVTGETVAQTVKRLRLHRAAGELINGRDPVAVIVQRSGYGSVAAFTRAFHEAYGVPPAQYRRQGGLAHFTLAPPGDPHMYSVHIVPYPERQAVTVAHRGSYLKIGQAFDTVGTWAGMHGAFEPGSKMVGIYFDDPAVVAEADLRSLAGITVTNAPAALAPPFQMTKLRGGEYAVLRHRGPYAELAAAYQWLYGTWLPQSGREAADAPPIEEYVNTPLDTAPPDLLTDICVPLQPAQK